MHKTYSVYEHTASADDRPLESGAEFLPHFLIDMKEYDDWLAGSTGGVSDICDRLVDPEQPNRMNSQRFPLKTSGIAPKMPR